jgi:hypothetical protein
MEPTPSLLERVAKLAIIGTIRTAGDTAEQLVRTGRDLLLLTVGGAEQVTVAAEKGSSAIVVGAIDAAKAVGEDVFKTVHLVVHGTVKGAAEAGADVGAVAVRVTEATIHAAEKAGTDAGLAMKHAVTGAIHAAEEIGDDTAAAVRDVLLQSVKGAKDVIKAPFRREERG